MSRKSTKDLDFVSEKLSSSILKQAQRELKDKPLSQSELLEAINITYLLPVSDYNNLIYIYLTMLEKKEINRIIPFITNPNNTILIRAIKSHYDIQTPYMKNKIRTTIFNSNNLTSSTNFTKTMDLLKVELKKLKSEMLVRILLYLSKTLEDFRASNSLRVTSPSIASRSSIRPVNYYDKFSFLNDETTVDFTRPLENATTLIRKINETLEAIFRINPELFKSAFLKISNYSNIAVTIKTTKPRGMSSACPAARSSRSSRSSRSEEKLEIDEVLLFNLMFIDLKEFMQTDDSYESIIKYYLLFDKNSGEKAAEIFKNLYCFDSGDVFFTFVKEQVGINSREDFDELVRRKDYTSIKVAFLKFVKLYYTSLLKHKDVSRITAEEKAAILEILNTIIKIFEDDDYSKSKYEKEFDFFRNIRVLKSYKTKKALEDLNIRIAVTYVLGTHRIPEFNIAMRLLFENEISELKPYEKPLTFLLEEEPGKNITTTLTEGEEARMRPRRLYEHEFNRNLRNDPEALKDAFVDVIYKQYEEKGRNEYAILNKLLLGPYRETLELIEQYR